MMRFRPGRARQERHRRLCNDGDPGGLAALLPEAGLRTEELKGSRLSTCEEGETLKNLKLVSLRSRKELST